MILVKNKSNNWHEKAIQRRTENKELKKRIKELKKSREEWKVKAQQVKEVNKKIKHETDSIKKILRKIVM